MTESSTETVVEPTETPSSSTTTQTTDSSSSASSAETKPAETILDRVKATYQKSTEAAPASRTSGTSATAVDPAKSTADDGSKELAPEELAALAPRTQARMQKLTSDLKAQGQQLQALQPKAAEYDKIDTFIRQNGLQPRDVQSVAEIAAMLVHNPQGARERLQPIMAELDRILGVVLPPELQQRVEQGYMTHEDALRLSQAEAAGRFAVHRASTLTENQRREQQVSQQRQAVDSSLNAMDTWEKTTAKNDPDWHTKQSEISDRVELAIERKTREIGRPWFPDPTEATKLLADAYEAVNAKYKRFSPKPTAINPPVTTGASPRSTQAPKNTLDIIRGQINR